jgi:DNA-binding MarR family transcriptional regulator
VTTPTRRRPDALVSGDTEDSGDTGEIEQVVQLLHDLMDEMRRHFEATMAAAGLSPTQGKALRHLEEPMNMRELASRLRVDASYITSIVDGLEVQGLVDRSVDPADRRVKILVLTPRGRRRYRELTEALFTDLPGLSHLDPDERATFRRLLVRMLDAAGA